MSPTIIVPLDGSHEAERALPVATFVHERTGAPVVLVMAREPGLPRDLDEYLNGLVARLEMRVEHVIVDTRDAVEAISGVVARYGDPLVVMSSHGPSALDEVVVGSVTAETLHTIDAPLLLVGPETRLAAAPLEPAPVYGTLLVCLDGSKASEEAIPLAQRWAPTLGLGVFVTQVLEPADGRVLGDPMSHETPNESGYVAAIAHRLERAGIDATYEVLHDHRPAKAIVRQAQELANPLIVMATHGRTGLARIALGSVAMSVVRHAPCPVLVRRPGELSE